MEHSFYSEAIGQRREKVAGIRLLTFDDNDRLSFMKPLQSGELYGENAKKCPPYAILSHTWRHDQHEITHEDILRGNLNKKGYDKIKFCIDRARCDGLRHFWVDSCCIDKSDHNEWSWAMRLMYRWYAHAEKCYVYLTDTPILQKCRWVTRGWTLQELVGPAIVEFFYKGEFIGSKASLEQELNQTCDIPIAALRGRVVYDFSIQERWKWQKGRQVTKPHDFVYSMLSLFQSSLDVNYAESSDQTKKRFDEELRSTHPDFNCTPGQTRLNMRVSESIYVDSLELKKKYLGKAHVSTLATMHDLGAVYFRQERFDLATATLTAVLGLREAILGRDDLETLDTVHELGSLYAFVDKLDQAETLLQRARDGRARELGPNDTTTLDTTSELGRLYCKQQKFDKATKLFEQLRREQQQRSDSGRTCIFSAEYELGRIYVLQSKLDEAERLLTSVKDARQRLLGRRHDAMYAAYAAIGEMESARARLLLIRSELRYDRDQSMQTEIDWQAGRHHSQSEAYLRWAIRGQDYDMGRMNTSSNAYLSAFAATHAYLLCGPPDIDVDETIGEDKEVGRAFWCERKGREALESQEKILGRTHTSTLSALCGFAYVLQKLERHDEAERHYRECLDRSLLTVAPTDTITARVYFQLGTLYCSQSRTVEAKSMYLEALAAYEELFGLAHFGALHSLFAIWTLCRQQGEFDEANRLYRRARAVREQIDKDSRFIVDMLYLCVSSTSRQTTNSSSETWHSCASHVWFPAVSPPSALELEKLSDMAFDAACMAA